MPFLHRDDAVFSFTNRAALSLEPAKPFADQLNRITTLKELNRTPPVQAAVDAERRAELFKEVLHLVCWNRSTDHLLPLDFFQIHDCVVAHNGPLYCPNDVESHLNSFDYFTDLYTIKVHFWAGETQRWVVVRESACSHSDPWRTMNCFVQELRKELNKRAGPGAEPMQLPNISRYRHRGTRGARRARITASAPASGQTFEESNWRPANQDPASTSGQRANISNLAPVVQTAAPVRRQDGEAKSEPVNPFRADLNHHRKDSVQPTSSFGDEKTKKDLAQIWRQPWRVDGHA